MAGPSGRGFAWSGCHRLQGSQTALVSESQLILSLPCLQCDPSCACAGGGDCGPWGCPFLFVQVPPSSPLVVPRTLEMPLLQRVQRPARSAWRGRWVVWAFRLRGAGHRAPSFRKGLTPGRCTRFHLCLSLLLVEKGEDRTAPAGSGDGAEDV